MSRWREVKRKGRTGSCTAGSDTESPVCASIADRVKAFITDTFLIGMPIVYAVFYLVMGSRENFREHMGLGWLIIFGVHALAVLLFWAIKAQTPGMKAYGLLLVDARHGGRAKLPKLVWRYLLMQVSVFSIAGVLLPFFRRDKKALHDLFSSTCLIAKPES